MLKQIGLQTQMQEIPSNIPNEYGGGSIGFSLGNYQAAELTMDLVFNHDEIFPDEIVLGSSVMYLYKDEGGKSYYLESKNNGAELVVLNGYYQNLSYAEKGDYNLGVAANISSEILNAVLENKLVIDGRKIDLNTKIGAKEFERLEELLTRFNNFATDESIIQKAENYGISENIKQIKDAVQKYKQKQQNTDKSTGSIELPLEIINGLNGTKSGVPAAAPQTEIADAKDANLQNLDIKLGTEKGAKNTYASVQKTTSPTPAFS